MKKFRILAGFMMLALCFAILTIGVYAIKPTANNITGNISISGIELAEVDVTCFVNGVQKETHDNIKQGITWKQDISSLSFNTTGKLVVSEVESIVLTIRIQNESSTQSLGAYFHTGDLPTTSVVDKGVIAGYASAENILIEDSIYDKTNAQDKIADVKFSPYTYIGKKSDTNKFDVVDMSIILKPAELYASTKTNSFSYTLRVEPYVSNVDASDIYTNYSYDEYANLSYTASRNTFPFVKLAESVTRLDAYAFEGFKGSHYVIPSSVTNFSALGDSMDSHSDFNPFPSGIGVAICSSINEDIGLAIEGSLGISAKSVAINGDIFCTAYSSMYASCIDWNSDYVFISPNVEYLPNHLNDGARYTAFDNYASFFVAHNENFSSDGYGSLYNSDKTILMKGAKELYKFTVPASVTTINTMTFKGCNGLFSVYIPSTVTTINCVDSTSTPFYGCSKDITILCQATSKPAGWDEYWNYYTYNSQLTTYWNQSA